MPNLVIKKPSYWLAKIGVFNIAAFTLFKTFDTFTLFNVLSVCGIAIGIIFYQISSSPESINDNKKNEAELLKISTTFIELNKIDNELTTLSSFLHLFKKIIIAKNY